MRLQDLLNKYFKDIVIIIILILFLLLLFIGNKYKNYKHSINTVSTTKTQVTNKPTQKEVEITNAVVTDSEEQDTEEPKENKEVEIKSYMVDGEKLEYVTKVINGVYVSINKKLADKSEAELKSMIARSYTGKFNKPQVIEKKEITINTSDEDLLARLINSEAGNEPYEGKLAVGAVVLNRARTEGSSIKSVIYAPHQFDGVQTHWFNDEPPEDCIKASKEVLAGKNVVPTSYHFCDLNLCNPDWAHELKFIRRIGDHWFFE